MKTRYINMDLARKRGLTDDHVEALEVMHLQMFLMAVGWRGLTDAERKHMRRRTKRAVRVLEFGMQTLWGFEQDGSRHTHWRRFPGLRPKREAKERRAARSQG